MHERLRGVARRLSVPMLRPGLVERPRLVEGLMNAPHVPVVLVSAPAGYGKTTLLAQWRERDERPFAWLTLEAADNDPVALTVGVIAALALVLDLDPGLVDVLNASEPELDAVVLPMLVDGCAKSGKRCVLVLDDVHRVTEGRCGSVLVNLANHLPSTCQLALATCTDPPLRLASRRAHGRLLELRATDLALGAEEASALLAAAGVTLPPDRVSQLVERTEGWPAGLYLAALALRDREDPEDFVEHFAGTTRHVADFLSEDVLGRQPADIIDFLLGTSVLDELTPSLCDAVVEGDSAEQTLLELERSNLFVVPLDEDRHAYRYHHLFAEYLRAELARREPDRVPDLHRRAWRWYREHNHLGPAIRHAQACGDTRVAAALVATAYRPLAQRGQIETVRDWLAEFSDAQLRDHPPLAIVGAWMAALDGEGERAERLASWARRGSWQGPMPDGSASLASALALMPKVAGVSQMYADARKAVDLEPPGSPWRPTALLRLGVAQSLTGGDAAAVEAFREAVALTGPGSNQGPTSGGAALAYLAWISLDRGDVDVAWDYAGQALERAERPGMGGYMPNIATYAVVADLRARRGELSAAATAIDRVDELLPKATETAWWLKAHAALLIAPVLASLGRDEEAMARLDGAAEILARHPDAGRLHDWYRETARGLRRHPRSQPASSELSDAERRILRLLVTKLTLREIGDELCLSLNTVKTHTHSIYKKLGATSRAEAVDAARARDAIGDSPG
jgi:LuxR family maltose regulon positive regulatory protein